jgi:alkylated DNA nucleotide flippase Atl1
MLTKDRTYAPENGDYQHSGRALEGLRLLEELAKLPQEENDNRRLRCADIEALPVFNNRAAPDERAIADLVKVLTNGDKLPAVTVLRVGGRNFLIDGHQRLEAFRLHAAKAGRGGRFVVPVTYFHGTPAEAVFASIERNSQHGVKLTASERTDAAWKLVLIGAKTRTEMTKATGVSRGWLTKMRQVMRALGDEASDHPQWHRALRAADGRNQKELTDEEYEERKRMKAERIADQVTQIVGNHSSDPELMAMVIEAVMGRNLVPLIRRLREDHEDALTALDQLENDADF